MLAVHDGRLEGDIAVDLVSPSAPARAAPARKELEVGPRTAALDDGVLLLRLVRVVLHRRVEPAGLTAELDRRPAAGAEQQVLGLGSQVLPHAEVRLYPGQD